VREESARGRDGAERHKTVGAGYFSNNCHDARRWQGRCSEVGVMTAVPGVWEWSGGVGAIRCLEIDFWNVLRSRQRYAIGRFALRATRPRHCQNSAQTRPAGAPSSFPTSLGYRVAFLLQIFQASESRAVLRSPASPLGTNEVDPNRGAIT
jgi:hypothetical protein